MVPLVLLVLYIEFTIDKLVGACWNKPGGAVVDVGVEFKNAAVAPSSILNSSLELPSGPQAAAVDAPPSSFELLLIFDTAGTIFVFVVVFN